MKYEPIEIACRDLMDRVNNRPLDWLPPRLESNDHGLACLIAGIEMGVYHGRITTKNKCAIVSQNGSFTIYEGLNA